MQLSALNLYDAAPLSAVAGRGADFRRGGREGTVPQGVIGLVDQDKHVAAIAESAASSILSGGRDVHTHVETMTHLATGTLPDAPPVTPPPDHTRIASTLSRMICNIASNPDNPTFRTVSGYEGRQEGPRTGFHAINRDGT